MNKKDIVLLWSEDWEALYINDKKVAEGHSLSPRDIFVALGYKYISKEAPKIKNIYEGKEYEEYDFPDELPNAN